ncbi:MAG: hypothetical protein ABWZ88_12785, partial [Variovorax sp.]
MLRIAQASSGACGGVLDKKQVDGSRPLRLAVGLPACLHGACSGERLRVGLLKLPGVHGGIAAVRVG